MNTWKGLFTENEAKEIIYCIDTQIIKNEKHSNRDNLKIAINEHLGSSPMRDSIINKIEDLTQEQVNEIINAASGIAREVSVNKTSMEGLIQNVFNPQEE
ncbi:hypothetical protein M2651_01140 [Clostridium sp. SYSU_GA19001]|uniref:hypothetical protein n=1 Tax=Clostridium caldaquaticum TaxID=2940653 RepID=UPI002077813F|nr:hypothetical protein [Clostridium caldaquaticum]MCM8709624.1 hypothetical protein [Clostridium caldaquaticum]